MIHIYIALLGVVVFHPKYEEFRLRHSGEPRCVNKRHVDAEICDWLNEARYLGGWEWR